MCFKSKIEEVFKLQSSTNFFFKIFNLICVSEMEGWAFSPFSPSYSSTPSLILASLNYLSSISMQTLNRYHMMKLSATQTFSSVALVG